jgi:hypothetical protein
MIACATARSAHRNVPVLRVTLAHLKHVTSLIAGSLAKHKLCLDGYSHRW